MKIQEHYVRVCDSADTFKYTQVNAFFSIFASS